MFNIVSRIIKKYLKFIFKTNLYTEEDFGLNFYKNMNETAFYYRCANDPIFFFENCINSDIKINEQVKLFIDSFINKQTLVVYNQRAIGMTTGYLILTTWLLTFYPSYNILIIFPTNIHIHNFKTRLLNLLDSVTHKKMKHGYIYFKLKNTIEIPDNLSQCKLTTLNSNEEFYGINTLNTIFVDNAEMNPKIENLFKLFVVNELLEYCKSNNSTTDTPYTPNGFVISSSFGNFSHKNSVDYAHYIFDNYKRFGFEDYLTLKISDK